MEAFGLVMLWLLAIVLIVGGLFYAGGAYFLFRDPDAKQTQAPLYAVAVGVIMIVCLI